jgi:hypothetical protein
MNKSLWTARFLIGFVFFFNVQCALAFLFDPAAYAPAFDLHGSAAESAMRGFGILFLMWNVPYGFALFHPRHYRTSLLQAIIMQAIGVIGESILRLSLENPSPILISSINRFIVFDGAGLIVLGIAWAITSRKSAVIHPMT